MNSYQKGDATVFKFMWRSFSFDMLPSAEKITISKSTKGNEEKNKPGQCFLYYIDLRGSLVEQEVKEYGEICIVDLLPEGVHFATKEEAGRKPIFVCVSRGNPLFDERYDYVPDIIENYHNSGRTALIFHIKESNLRKIWENNNGLAQLAFYVTIDNDAHTGTITNYAYVVGDNLEEYREPTGGTLDIYDLNNNGRTDDMIAYDTSEATIVAAQSLYAEKFIARAGSGAWQKQGLYLSVGSEFDYLLKITNETSDEHRGLLVYDTLPRINDDNIFNTATRNSQFPVYLRSAIEPPAGYTVYYTASESVYDNSMDVILADETVSWMAEAEVSDWTAVTAFKITANDETVVLGGASTFEVTVPVRVVSMLSEESMAFLQGKVYENTKSGTMVYLQANNTFGFKADDLGTAESNNVWARIPFAGFKLKKVDATDETIVLPGTVFELRNAEGTLLQTMTTGADGFAKFENLTAGVYTLTETVVPNDYREDMGHTLTVTITQSDATGLYYFDFGKGYTGTGTSTDPLLVKNVPFAGFTLKKVDGRDGTTALPGAEFTLTDAEGNLLQTVTTGADGLASFDHLTDGVYTLTETKVPDGYRDVNLTLTVRVYWDSEAGQYEFIFDEGYTGAGTAADPLILENEAGYELPATGGSGIQMYTMGGLLLIGASAILLLYKKFRRGKGEEYSS